VTFNDPVFKAFNDFDLDDMPAQADISRRMLRRLEGIDHRRSWHPSRARRTGNQRRRTRRR